MGASVKWVLCHSCKKKKSVGKEIKGGDHEDCKANSDVKWVKE